MRVISLIIAAFGPVQRLSVFVLASLLVGGAAYAQQWPRVEQPAEGVTLIYDDSGKWGGPNSEWSRGTLPQVAPNCHARKTIDLSRLTDGVLAKNVF